MALNILSGRDVRGTGFAGSQRPNYVGGSIYADNRGPDAWFNRNAFAFPANGQYGNVGRNIGLGAAVYQLDLSFIKNTRLFQEQNLQFRAEMFNFPNTPIWNAPVNQLTNVNFGRILNAQPGRQIQLALRYQF